MVQRRSMPMIKRCCFSRNLRAGAVACGIWTLAWCCYSMATSVWGLTIDINVAPTDPVSGDAIRPPDPLTTGDAELDPLVWTTFCVSFLTFLSSILVIVAVFKAGSGSNYITYEPVLSLLDNAKLMIPWMVMVGLLLLLDAATIIVDIVTKGFKPHLIASLMIWVFISLINIYCELCVISHYQEVKLGRGGVHDYVGTVVRVPPASVRAVAYQSDVHLRCPTDGLLDECEEEDGVEWLGSADLSAEPSIGVDCDLTSLNSCQDEKSLSKETIGTDSNSSLHT